MARTKILLVLDKQYCGTGELVNKTGLSYNVVLYHLRLLRCDGIVEHKGDRRYVWVSTDVGQTRLV
jgi:predicted transcriptional regulator